MAIILLAGLIVALAAGCQSASSTAAESTATIQPTATPRVSRTVVAQAPTPVPTPTSTDIPEDDPIALTFWTVEQISPMATGEAGSFVASSLRLFERTNSDVDINLHIKKPSGKGGVMDFLRTAKEVAPSVMPDVVVMGATDLNQAYADNLVQPLDGRLDRSIVQDLLPASRRIGTVDDRLVGVPLGIEIEHTVYNTLTFTGTPMLWSDVLSKNSVYLFPAKGVNGLVNDVTLSQYFSAGGSLIDAEGLPTIDDGVLKDVFGFYEQARELGIIDSSILEAAATEDLWPVYLEGRAGLAQISVRQYLTDRDLLNSTSFAPLPVQDREKTPVTVMHGWVLVLVTSDVSRQDAALRLIESFLATGNNAAWNRINKSIPTRDTAYQQLAGDDPYWEFLTEQLNSARPEPRFSGYDRIGRIIQQALEQVIRGEATAEEAAATAIDALAQ